MAKNIYTTPSFIETQLREGKEPEAIAMFIASKVPDFASKLETVKMKYGSNNTGAISKLLDWQAYGTTAPTERFQPPEVRQQPQGFFQRVGQDMKDYRAENPSLLSKIGGRIEGAGLGVRQSLDDYNAGKQGALQTGVQTAAQITSGILAPATETINTIGGEVLRATRADKAIGKGAQILSETSAGQAAIGAASDAYGYVKENYPQELRTAQTVGKAALDVADVATAGFGKKAASPVAQAVVSKVDDAGRLAAQKATQQAATNAAAKIDNTILEGIKAVRPSSAGKKTASSLAEYDDQAVLAVKTIIEKKDALKLVDDFGEEVTEQLPQNLRQFAEAVEQTRETVFKEYDDLAKQAGEAGAQVDLGRVANELIDTVTDPKFASLEDQHPEIAEYLLKRVSALEKRQFYTAEQAQLAVKNYNASLKSFYDNPSYDTYAKASIDAMIANNIRKGLDDAVEGLTGGQYAALKRKYGALKAIEADVVKRAVVDARKNAKGLLDFTDVLTGGDLLTGLVTFNPAQAARGGFGMVIKNYLKVLNDPNRNVRSMFRKADALLKATPMTNDL